jgi:hypothetical protein
MTIPEIVNKYMFNNISTLHSTGLGVRWKNCCYSMVEEMNEIKSYWLNNHKYRSIIKACIYLFCCKCCCRQFIGKYW